MDQDVGINIYLKNQDGCYYLKTYENDIQLKDYKNSVDELISHLNNKHKTLKDKDKKDDIKILLNNAKILKTYVDKL